MHHFNYHTHLKAIWDSAVLKYESGNREPDTYFDAEALADLATIGLNAMDLYDPVEDHLRGHEIDFSTFLMISDARRDYFLTVQKSIPSEHTLDPATLPAKTLEAHGILWLPRLMPKAIAKLRGELPSCTMYGCGGDRKFFKKNNIHPAEFLRVAWAYQNDESKIIDWVLTRTKT